MEDYQNTGRILDIMVNREIYVQNAKEILALLDKYPAYCPNMVAFAETEGGISILNLKKVKECGTIFCLAGLQAKEDDFPSEYICGFGDYREFNFYRYSRNKVGMCVLGTLDQVYWDFVYASTWPNTRDSAIKRMSYIIEHGDIPPVDLWKNFR